MKVWDIEASLRWTSADANHCERRFVSAFDPENDVLPGTLASRLAGLDPGDSASLTIGPGDGWIATDPSLRFWIRPEQFRRVEANGKPVEPDVGRFYPRRMLAGLPDRCPGAFRVVARTADGMAVDLNHPLAGLTLDLEIRLLEPAYPRSAGKAPGRNIVAMLADDGPGMQAALPDGTPDFHSNQPFGRADDSDDALFYAPARLVPHLDDTALQRLTLLYAPMLRPGMRVLDLMSSWDSHLPREPADLVVTGLGMNAEELACNPRLAARVVHDLNREPRLPCRDHSFDALLCSLSVEYLTRPVEVMRDAARVLKPGAPCALTFSERWFPPKAVRIWSELHPFERIALVLSHLRSTGGFERFSTESLRGRPRPPDDKYTRLTPWSDPLYLVIGRRAT